MRAQVVLLHGRFLKDVRRFLGEQIGSYFGHSLTVGDFNGDGLEDFSVGAPLFSDKKTSTHESGRVYVIYQNENQARDFFTNLRQSVNSEVCHLPALIVF